MSAVGPACLAAVAEAAAAVVGEVAAAADYVSVAHGRGRRGSACAMAAAGADPLVEGMQQTGRIGVTAIGDSPDQAHGLYRDVAKVLDGLAAEREATAGHR